MRVVWLLAALAGCGRLDFAPPPDPADAADRCAAEAVALGPFGAPTPVAAVNTPMEEDDPTPSDDGLELYFTSTRTGGLGSADVWRVRRNDPAAPWGPVEHVQELSTAKYENTPALSSDGLTMWLVSNRPGTLGDDDIWVSTRADRESPWAPPVDVAVLNSAALDRAPSPFLDDRALLFHSTRTGTTAFYVTTRADDASPWSPPTLLASPANGLRGWVSPCGLELYFELDRGTGTGTDFYLARRASVDEPFGASVELTELSSQGFDQDIRLSPDRRHVYFASNRGGNGDIYEASR